MATYHKRRKYRWLIIAGYIGECCERAHATYFRSGAERWQDVIDGYKAKLEAQGFDVGEIYAIPL